MLVPNDRGTFQLLNTHVLHGDETRDYALPAFRALMDAAAGSPRAFDDMWHTLEHQLAAAVAAAHAPAMSWSRSARLPHTDTAGFELLGVDVILDEWLHPWVIEFNNDPEMQLLDEVPGHMEDRQAVVAGVLRMVHAWHLLRNATSGAARLQRQEERVARAHGYRVLTGMVQQAAACVGRPGSEQCSFMGGLECGLETHGSRHCVLHPRDVLMPALARCPSQHH